MVLINSLFFENHTEKNSTLKYMHNELVGNILEYINKNMSGTLTIETIANEFFISSAYACRLFKRETGTTINKYITARKISIAKSMLANGSSVKEACDGSGFNDYANFIKSFGKAVGVSPKKYSRYNLG
jgi:YesN/AraC family two-component response regulator